MGGTDEERVRVAIDGWEKPSEMMDGLAWMIALLVRRAAGGEMVEEGDGAGDDVKPKGADDDEALPDAKEDWFMELVERDRLAGWKKAVGAHVQAQRLWAAIFGDEKGRQWARSMQREVDAWRDFDEIPGGVALHVAQHLASGLEWEAWAALVRQDPEVAEAMKAIRLERDGEWPAWLSRLTLENPVRGIKVAAEAAMRVGLKGRTGGGRGRRFGVPVFPGVGA